MEDRFPDLAILNPPSSLLDEPEYVSSLGAKDKMT